MATADRFYQLGLKAEARGAEGVARLHYRMAVKHGSQRAVARLARLERADLAATAHAR